MTDPSDTWAAARQRLNDKPARVRVRFLRWCLWLMRNQPTPF
ncbi:hypothetical protein [Roseateles sp. P5_E11]